MKLNTLFLLSLFLLLGSCGTFKKNLTQKGGNKEAVQNAILDFSNTSRLYNNDSVFSVWVYDKLHKMVLKETDDRNSEWVEDKLYEGIVAVSISASHNKILYTDGAKIGQKGVKMPTRFIEKDGKLFYWRDDDYPLTQETLTVFKKYNLLVNNDLDGVVEFYDFTVNDAQKGVHYYFCKNNLLKYKKITIHKAIGYYDAPSINCSSR
ncbi:hypothetical protein [Ascidiimonas aurantiaca]|uniref:hypothetical protein n=1 Tax=Ascidiimonas aurantiaca TaxID=1685432 RepID=UPI0030EF0312